MGGLIYYCWFFFIRLIKWGFEKSQQQKQVQEDWRLVWGLVFVGYLEIRFVFFCICSYFGKWECGKNYVVFLCYLYSFVSFSERILMFLGFDSKLILFLQRKYFICLLLLLGCFVFFCAMGGLQVRVFVEFLFFIYVYQVQFSILELFYEF